MAFRLGLGLGISNQRTSAVVAAPTISANPSKDFYDGVTAVTLSVTATGSGLTYQWYEGASGDTSTPVVGATAASYAASPSTHKRYWCRVTNGGGTADSTAAGVVPCTLTWRAENAYVTLSGSNITEFKPVRSGEGAVTFPKSGTTDWVQQAADADGTKAARGSGDSMYLGPNADNGKWLGYSDANPSVAGACIVVVNPRSSTSYETYLGASGGYNSKVEINNTADKFNLWSQTPGAANDTVLTGAVNKALKHAILTFWDNDSHAIALNGAAATEEALSESTGVKVDRRITFGAGATFNAEVNPTCDLFEVRILDHKPTANETADIWAILTARYPSIAWA